MNKEDVGRILNLLAESIESCPQVFNVKVEINSMGVVANNSGGVGISVNAIGGGAGSTTIGLHASPGLSNTHISILKGQAAEKLQQEISHLAQAIKDLAKAVETDANQESVWNRIKKDWVPSFLIQYLANVVSLASS